MSRIFLLLILMILSTFVTFSQQAGLNKSINLLEDTAHVRLIYLGAAGWEITDGRTVILVDPYLSRIRINVSPSVGSAAAEMMGDTRPVMGPTDPISSDTGVIDDHIKHADYILIHHSHFDHIMDVPYIARKTGAIVIGHESTTNLLKAYGIDEEKLITVRGGEDYEFGSFSLKVIPSIHSPLFQKHYYDSRIIPSHIKVPARLEDLVEGGSLAYLIRIDGYQILTFGSMNFIERELEGLKPDVALIGAGPSRKEIFDYTGRLVRILGLPPLILPTHWDNYILPYQASQDEQISKLDTFINEVRSVSPKSRVIIPKYFEPIVLGKRLK